MSAEQNEVLWRSVLRNMASPSYGEDHDICAAGTVGMGEGTIQRWLPQGREKHTAYHAKVAALEAELAIARREAVFADRVWDGTRVPIAAIRRVPDEIWLMIFGGATGQIKLATLTLVCRDWLTMLSTGSVSSLWNPVIFGDLDSPAREKWNTLLVTRMKRGGGPRVSFCLTHLSKAGLVAILEVDTFTQLKIREWYDLGPEQDLLREMIVKPWPRPLVDDLCIEGDTWQLARADAGWTLDWPRNSRRLDWRWARKSPRCLTLVCMVTPEDDLQFRWEDVEEYTEIQTIRNASSILRAHLTRLTNLRILRLAGVRFPNVNETGGRQRFPHLTELELLWKGGAWAAAPGCLLESVECPRLEALRVRGAWREDFTEDAARTVSDEAHAELKRFLERAPLLETLEIGLDHQFAAEQLIQHLRVSNRLTRLEISVPQGELFSAGLFSTLADVAICPSLQVFNIPPLWRRRDWGDGGGGFLALEAMCEARFAAGFETLDLRWLEEYPPDGSYQVSGRARWNETWDEQRGFGGSLEGNKRERRKVEILCEEKGWDIRVEQSGRL
ncbi:hypothetical protein DFH09DRAFT_1317686 [Mycena vulgaris]|nr:hypothetical protein DFH09DRAFT_1317686 [Mycena vulgaris]